MKSYRLSPPTPTAPLELGRGVESDYYRSQLKALRVERQQVLKARLLRKWKPGRVK